MQPLVKIGLGLIIQLIHSVQLNAATFCDEYKS